MRVNGRAALRGGEGLDLRIDFTVVFDDALVGGLEGELEGPLAAYEGVEAVLHEDREIFHLRVEGIYALELTVRGKRVPLTEAAR